MEAWDDLVEGEVSEICYSFDPISFLTLEGGGGLASLGGGGGLAALFFFSALLSRHHLNISTSPSNLDLSANTTEYSSAS